MFESACEGKRSGCRCRLLIDATGRSGTSWLSHLSPSGVLDRLIGVAWTGKQSGEWPYTLVESVDDGWFYSANLPGERVTVVYMADSDLYRHSLWHQLSKATHARKRLPCRADVSKLRLVSAASTVRLNPVGKGWCAVGDAAMSHDPLSGLGVNHALESAFQAAPPLDSIWRTGSLSAPTAVGSRGWSIVIGSLVSTIMRRNDAGPARHSGREERVYPVMRPATQSASAAPFLGTVARYRTSKGPRILRAVAATSRDLRKS